MLLSCPDLLAHCLGCVMPFLESRNALRFSTWLCLVRLPWRSACRLPGLLFLHSVAPAGWSIASLCAHSGLHRSIPLTGIFHMMWEWFIGLCWLPLRIASCVYSFITNHLRTYCFKTTATSLSIILRVGNLGGAGCSLPLDNTVLPTVALLGLKEPPRLPSQAWGLGPGCQLG